MTSKKEKINDILLALRSFAFNYKVKRYGKTYSVIHHKQLTTLLSDYVGYTAMPDRHTLNKWVNYIVYLKGFLKSNGSKSYERREYTFNMKKINEWLSNYNAETQKIFKRATKNQKSTTPQEPKQVMLQYYELAIVPKNNNSKSTQTN